LFAIRKVGQQKTLSSQRKIWLCFQESVFLENLGRKHFSEVMKNLEMLYYLLIISNLILKHKNKFIFEKRLVFISLITSMNYRDN